MLNLSFYISSNCVAFELAQFHLRLVLFTLYDDEALRSETRRSSLHKSLATKIAIREERASQHLCAVNTVAHQPEIDRGTLTTWCNSVPTAQKASYVALLQIQATRILTNSRAHPHN